MPTYLQVMPTEKAYLKRGPVVFLVGRKTDSNNNRCESRSIKRIVAFPPPRMAAQKPQHSTTPPSDTTVFVKSIQGVLGAGGLKTTSRKRKRGNAKAIKMDQKNKE
jgi:hypothetical protein